MIKLRFMPVSPSRKQSTEFRFWLTNRGASKGASPELQRLLLSEFLASAGPEDPVSQIALLYIGENQDRANDLGEAIKIEIKQAASTPRTGPREAGHEQPQVPSG